jgi:hypothetical protein
MISQGQVYHFDINNAQRDFDPLAKEVFLLCAEITETEWHYLGCVPTDGIGAIELRFDDPQFVVKVGFDAFNRRHRPSKNGELFLLKIRLLSQADWLKLEAMPRFTLGTAAIVWTSRPMPEEKPKRTPKAKPLKGEWGFFWREMDRCGFHNQSSVLYWLRVNETATTDERKEALRRKFALPSRTFIAPDDLLNAMVIGEREGFVLDGAITFVENVKARLGIAAVGVA